MEEEEAEEEERQGDVVNRACFYFKDPGYTKEHFALTCG